MTFTRARALFQTPIFFCFIPQLVNFSQDKYNRVMSMLCVDYITTKEAAKNFRITNKMVVYHCSAGRINGSKKRKIHDLFRLTLKNRLTDDIHAENEGR